MRKQDKSDKPDKPELVTREQLFQRGGGQDVAEEKAAAREGFDRYLGLKKS